jgi:hypothetical protein
MIFLIGGHCESLWKSGFHFMTEKENILWKFKSSIVHKNLNLNDSNWEMVQYNVITRLMHSTFASDLRYKIYVNRWLVQLFWLKHWNKAPY